MGPGRGAWWLRWGRERSDLGADAGTMPLNGNTHVRAYTPTCVEPTELAAGILVYVIAPDGTVQTSVTDAHGEASVDTAGDSTVMLQFADGLHAYVAVQPGDTVVDKHVLSCALDSSSAQAFVTFPAVPGATNYTLTGSCIGATGAGTAFAPAYYTGCAQLHDATVVVTTTDIGLDHPYYTSIAHVDLAAHGDSAHALALPALVPFDPYPVTITNLPSQVLKLFGEATRFSGPDPTALADASFTATLADSTGTGTALIAPVGDHTRLSAYLEVGPEAPVTPALQYTQTVATTPTGEIDASTMIRTATDYFPPLDTATLTQTWTEWPGAAPTSLSVVASWTLSGYRGASMVVTAPYTGPSFTLPALPPQLADLAPEPTSQWETFSITVKGYVGKTYRDVLGDTTSDAPLWSSYFE